MSENSNIVISWVDDNSVHQGYRIYKDLEYFDKTNLPVPIAELPNGITEYIDNDITVGVKYWYRVGVFTPHHVKLSSAILLEATAIIDDGGTNE